MTFSGWPYCPGANPIVNVLVTWETNAWDARGWNEDNRWLPRWSMRMITRLQYWRAAWLCLRGVKHDPKYCAAEITELPWYERAFCRAKAAVCLVLGLRSRKEHYRRHDIEVEWFDLHCYGTADGEGHNWTQARVGLGVFRNWFAHVEEDSS